MNRYDGWARAYIGLQTVNQSTNQSTISINQSTNLTHNQQARSLFYQVVKALDYLHERPILHRDLSWGNIMFKHDAQGRLLAKVKVSLLLGPPLNIAF